MIRKTCKSKKQRRKAVHVCLHFRRKHASPHLMSSNESALGSACKRSCDINKRRELRPTSDGKPFERWNLFLDIPNERFDSLDSARRYPFVCTSNTRLYDEQRFLHLMKNTPDAFLLRTQLHKHEKCIQFIECTKRFWKFRRFRYPLLITAKGCCRPAISFTGIEHVFPVYQPEILLGFL